MNCTRGIRGATRLADAMNPFSLKEALHRTIMAFEYVHRAESRRLEREEEADQIRHEIKAFLSEIAETKSCACTVLKKQLKRKPDWKSHGL